MNEWMRTTKFSFHFEPLTRQSIVLFYVPVTIDFYSSLPRFNSAFSRPPPRFFCSDNKQMNSIHRRTKNERRERKSNNIEGRISIGENNRVGRNSISCRTSLLACHCSCSSNTPGKQRFTCQTSPHQIEIQFLFFIFHEEDQVIVAPRVNGTFQANTHWTRLFQSFLQLDLFFLFLFLLTKSNESELMVRASSISLYCFRKKRKQCIAVAYQAFFGVVGTSQLNSVHIFLLSKSEVVRFPQKRHCVHPRESSFSPQSFAMKTSLVALTDRPQSVKDSRGVRPLAAVNVSEWLKRCAVTSVGVVLYSLFLRLTEAKKKKGGFDVRICFAHRCSEKGKSFCSSIEMLC